jgi:hypothetical protein
MIEMRGAPNSLRVAGLPVLCFLDTTAFPEQR